MAARRLRDLALCMVLLAATRDAVGRVDVLDMLGTAAGVAQALPAGGAGCRLGGQPFAASDITQGGGGAGPWQRAALQRVTDGELVRGDFDGNDTFDGTAAVSDSGAQRLTLFIGPVQAYSVRIVAYGGYMCPPTPAGSSGLAWPQVDVESRVALTEVQVWHLVPQDELT